jgi:hypothetical protein
VPNQEIKEERRNEMTSVDQNGNVVIKLTTLGDATVSVSLTNVKPSALDADVYAVAYAIAGLLDYSIASITRNEKTLLNA